MAQVVSELGDWMARVAVLGLIAGLGGAKQAGGVGLLYAGELAIRLLPAAAWGPLAGPLADRVSRRALMIGADLARAVLTLGLLLVDTPDDLPLLYGLLIAQMSVSVFFQAARQASVPGTLPSDELHSAYALTAATWSTMLAVGALTGAVLIGVTGVKGLFVLDSATYVVSALLLVPLRLAPTERQPQPFAWRDVLLLRDIRRGLDHVRERQLLPALFAKTFWGAAGGYLVLISLGGVQHAAGQGGDEALASGSALAVAGAAVGWLYGARGLGTGLGPLIARRVLGSSERALRRQVSLGFVVGAAGYVAFGFLDDFAARFCAVTFAHMGGSVLWVGSTTMWQRRVDDRFRGRVYACEFLGFTLTFTLGGFLAGWVFDASGSLARTAWTSSGLVLVMGLAWSLWSYARPPADGADA